MNFPVTMNAAESRRLDARIRSFRELVGEGEDFPARVPHLFNARIRAAGQLLRELEELGYPTGVAASLDNFIVWYDADENGTARLYHHWIAPRTIEAEG